MKFQHITVKTTHDYADLVASAMFDAGAEGVEILDSEDLRELLRSDTVWDYVDENLLVADPVVRVSAVTAIGNAGFSASLADELDALAERGAYIGEVESRVIDDEDWANEWKKYFKPIVTDSVTVVPTWIAYSSSEGEKLLRLDPGMAFGTGEHATTRMCLELMRAAGRSVIDVGCGSGILGIAAAITGAKSVYMCDIDPQAVKAARNNAELNGVDCEIEQADLLATSRRAELILANLTADLLIRMAPAVREHLEEGGKLVVSGIIAERLDEVKDAFSRLGYKVEKEAAEGDWRALVLGC